MNETAATATGSSGGLLARLRPMALPLVSVVLIGAAVVVIHVVTRDVRVHEVRDALAAIPAWQMALSALFTAVSFAALGMFDVLAVTAVAPGAVKIRVAAAAGALGHAVSNVLGFGVLTGGALRYRIYSAEGLDAASVLRVIGTSYLALVFGFMTLLGLTLILDPSEVSPLHWLGPRAAIVVGAAILASIVAFVAWTAWGVRTLAFRGWSVTLPGPRVAAGQIAAGCADIAASATALYVLLPDDLTISLPLFLVIYGGAILLGIASHVPGGLGAFDATMIAALGQSHRAEVIAALIVYRLIYYGVPFVLAVGALAAFEASYHRQRLSAATREVMRILHPVVPVAAAGLVFFAGLVLLVSGALPAEESRLGWLQDLMPLPLVEASHLVGSIAGVALLILARGLMRRFHVAWLATELLLLAGVVVSLAKGFDYEEAAIMAAVAALLLPFRSSFYRTSGFSEMRLSPAWFAMVLAGVAAATWLGFFSYRHVEYSSQLWWQFAWNGNAPRFLRATVAVSAVVVWAAVAFLIHRPATVRFRPDPVSDVVRRLVAAAPQTQPNVALLGDKKFLVAEDESAFLMYGRSGRSWISMGDPVGGGPAAVELIWRLRELADRNGGRTIYYAVSQSYLPTFLDMGLSILKIGEIARVDLSVFSLEGKKRQDFRYADRRATKEGLVFEVIPKADVPARIEELQTVSDAWLAQKSGHEKGFSLGFFSPSYLAEFDCAVLRDENGIQAFANLWRSGGREEMSVDIMRYRPQRSPILMDALFARLLLYAKGEGYRWFNLGAAPLAGLAQHPLASTWNKLGTLVYRHAEDFYHFEGLKAFKQKFEPVWAPQYIAGPGGLALPGILLDVTGLVSGGKLGVLAK